MADKPDGDARDELVIDASVLRALAHPIRTQLLSSLRRRGPSTATLLAQQLDLDTGTTSYHLRQLAASGLIAEDSTRGNQRDRWWKAAHRTTRFDDIETARNEPELTATYLHNIVRLNTDELLRFVDALPTLPRSWQKAATMNDTALQLTPSDLTHLLEEIDGVIDRYRTSGDKPRRGARTVVLHVNGFPRMPL
jgi:DNA-binding transcriptional ArsR family regulator